MRTLAFIASLMVLTASPVLAAPEAESDPDTAGEPIGAEDANTPVNLTGSWVLNDKLSDPFEPPTGAGGQGDGRHGGGSRGGGKGGGRGGGMGGGRGGGMGGGRGGGSQPTQDNTEQRQAEQQQKMEEMTQKVARITIFQEGLEFNVTDGRDISHLLYTDGREMTIWTDRGQATASAYWNGPVLVTRWRMGKDQPENVRRFLLDGTTDRLIVTDTFTRPDNDQATTRTMTYDRDS